MDVFSLAASLTLNVNNYMSSLTSASTATTSFSERLSSGLKTAAKIGTAAISTAAAGIVSLTKMAVESYAEYEQLVGGVDTLFKDASQKVQEYANNAYMTAGMSANDYMENATAFSASLISALGGDTAAAAEYANRAMVSMSDNANKMGTNMDSIVATYQSLSRGNYAMLDNLKLGYGGTKAELQRLIADAATYTDVQKEMGVTVDASSMSFDNIVNAIAVVQGHLGIAGATALEAGTTIEGSVNSMKAAWSNLVAGLANENADIGKLIDNLVTTIVGDGTESNLGVLGNIMPAVKQALVGVSKLISNMLPIILREIPSILAENIPILAEGVTNVFKVLLDSILQNEDVPAPIRALAEAINTLIENFNILTPILAGAIASMIAYKAATSISNIISALTAATQGQTIAQTLLNAVMNANPFVLVATLIAGLVAAIVVLWNTNDGFRNAVTNAWNAVKNGISAAGNAIKTVFSNLGASVESLKENVKNKFNNMTSMFSNLGENFKNIGSNIVKGVWNGISSGWTWLTDKVKSLANSLVDGVKNVLGIHSPSRVFAGIGNFMTQGLEQGWEQGYDGVRDTITGGLDFSNANAKIANIPATDAPMPAYAQQAQGDTYIPIYFGSELLDTVLIRAGNRINYRSGGRVNV